MSLRMHIVDAIPVFVHYRTFKKLGLPWEYI